MDDDLAAYLAPLTAFAEERHTWPTGPMRLRCYLTERPPPLRYVTSARGIVIDGDRVLAFEDPNNDKNLMPGGRLEPNETPEDALRRELLEETGWSLAAFRPIGLLHFHHLKRPPDGWPYPHPDFLQIVYAGVPDEYRPEMKEPDFHVIGSEFLPIDEARQLDLDAGQQVFLGAAVAALSR
jgi:8-oxo-dGTP diphosphatase